MFWLHLNDHWCFFLIFVDFILKLVLLWAQLTKIYPLTGEEGRIPFIFADFHFCRSRVIGLDMTENRNFTLCRMITWVTDGQTDERTWWNQYTPQQLRCGRYKKVITFVWKKMRCWFDTFFQRCCSRHGKRSPIKLCLSVSIDEHSSSIIFRNVFQVQSRPFHHLADLTLFFNGAELSFSTGAEMSWCRTVFFNGCRTVLFP
jgi:hypothetical protein